MLKVAIFNDPAPRERPFCPEPSVALQVLYLRSTKRDLRHLGIGRIAPCSYPRYIVVRLFIFRSVAQTLLIGFRLEVARVPARMRIMNRNVLKITFSMTRYFGCNVTEN